MTHRSVTGFTLVEILVVISIVVLLAVFVIDTLSESTAQSRDTERQSDLRNLQTAIELYRQENGRYPEGCNGANAWSGEPGSDVACASVSGQYIEGLAPKYIRTLPSDPQPNGSDSGYAYKVNGDGSVYKLVVFNSVEVLQVSDASGVVDQDLQGFKLCDNQNNSGDLAQLCIYTHAANGWGGNAPSWCRSDSAEYRSSYAVWAGFTNHTNMAQQERFTEAIVCDAP